jgi:H+-transporting ATPase
MGTPSSTWFVSVGGCGRVPSAIVHIASIADVLIIPTLAAIGVFMKPLPLSIIFAVFGSAIVLALVLDIIKVAVFRFLGLGA